MNNSLRQEAIRTYLSKINFKTDQWSYNIIEEDMKKFLGERPSLDVKYEKDVLLNETTGIVKEIKKIKSISVIFTDDDDKIKKIDVLIDG